MLAPFFVESLMIRRAFLVFCGLGLKVGSVFPEVGAVLSAMVLFVSGTGGIQALYWERPGVPGKIESLGEYQSRTTRTVPLPCCDKSSLTLHSPFDVFQGVATFDQLLSKLARQLFDCKARQF